MDYYVKKIYCGNSRMSAKNNTYTLQRAKTCHLGNSKTHHYFTTGRKITRDNFTKMQKEILKPYQISPELKSIEDVKKYWEDEKNKKMEENKAGYRNKHNYKSRLKVLWKSERLFVPEKVELPGGCLTEDIDPTFFTIVTGRPIKEKKNMVKYIQDLRHCFLTRLQTGYYKDEILLMGERYRKEKKRLDEIKENFSSCLKGFEQFLKEDHVSSLNLLKIAEDEEKKSKDKLGMINGLKEEMKNLQTDVLLVEEKWRNLKMFQKFLYVISPSEWRKVHDPYYGREDVGVVASDPCFFDGFREFPGDEKLDLDAKISKFEEDLKEEQPPLLPFSDPQCVLKIFADLERNNLRALTLSKELDFPAEEMMDELRKLKVRFEQDQNRLEEDIKYLKKQVEGEENKCKINESKMKETVFGFFRDLITNEEYLTVTSFVEDAYENAVAPKDSNLGLVEMIREIELKYENLLLDLDVTPNAIMTRTTKLFYKEQKRELKEAKNAEKKVHQMETLLNRLSKSLSYPRKAVRERKIVPRSLPPEELMFRYKLPKILTKEQRDHSFFFGRTPDNVRLYKPLCL